MKIKFLLFCLIAFFIQSSSNCQAVIVVDTTVGTASGASNGDSLTIGGWNTLINPIIGGGGSLADPTHNASNGLNGFDSNALTSYNGNWNFTYGAVTDTITGINLTIGIYDHDSAAAGDQVATFTVDGINLTSELNTLLNASGGNTLPFQAEYNIYTLALPNTTFASLADGNAAIALTMQNGFAAALTVNNNTAVDFSRLQISAVPEPNSAVLFLSAGAFVACRRKRRRRLATC